jgi:hypothetical protein
MQRNSPQIFADFVTLICIDFYTRKNWVFRVECGNFRF